MSATHHFKKCKNRNRPSPGLYPPGTACPKGEEKTTETGVEISHLVEMAKSGYERSPENGIYFITKKVSREETSRETISERRRTAPSARCFLVYGRRKVSAQIKRRLALVDESVGQLWSKNILRCFTCPKIADWQDLLQKRSPQRLPLPNKLPWPFLPPSPERSELCVLQES